MISGISNINSYSYTYGSYSSYGSAELNYNVGSAVVQLLIAFFFLYFAKAFFGTEQPSQGALMVGSLMFRRAAKKISIIMCLLGAGTIICNVRLLARLKINGAFDNWQNVYKTSGAGFISSLAVSVAIAAMMAVSNAVIITALAFWHKDVNRVLYVPIISSAPIVPALMRLQWDFFSHTSEGANALYGLVVTAFLFTMFVFNANATLLDMKNDGCSLAHLAITFINAILSLAVVGGGDQYMLSPLGHSCAYVYLVFSWVSSIVTVVLWWRANRLQGLWRRCLDMSMKLDPNAKLSVRLDDRAVKSDAAAPVPPASP